MPEPGLPVMKTSWIHIGLVLIASSSGCSFYVFGIHNMVHAPVEAWNDCKQKIQFRKIARSVWKEYESSQPHEFSKYYIDGFEEGFVDYLFAGGRGEPPAIPPWIYRSTHFDTPEGPQAIEDWYAGFRHGVREAQASGIRNWVVKPISLPPFEEPGIPATPRDSRPTAETTEEILPQPRTIPKGEPLMNFEGLPMQIGSHLPDGTPINQGPILEYQTPSVLGR